MPFIKTRDGTELYVKDWGQGRPVVLMHGWPLTADSWDVQALGLAEAGFRVIAYDRRGFGRSDQPSAGYDYDTFSDDLADVMAATGATDDCAIVGYSMGSGEIARYLSRHDGRGVTRAALVSPVVPRLLKTEDNPHGYDPAQFDKQTAQMLADRPHFFRSYVKSLYGVDLLSHAVSADTLDWTWRITMQGGLHPLVAAREAFGRTDFRPDLPAFRVPTLIVHGDADTDAPIEATARAAADGIRGARLIEYEGAPHGLPITHADRLSADLLAFLRAN